MKGRSNLPFDVNVAHLLAADADVVQEDVVGVPDDAAQEEPESHDAAYQTRRFEERKVLFRSASSSVFVLLCFAGGDVERGTGGSKGLGKQIHPHHQTALREQHRKTFRTHTHTNMKTHTLRSCYLLYLRLQGAVQGPRLHMLRDQSHSSQYMKGQLLFNRAEVMTGYIPVL